MPWPTPTGATELILEPLSLLKRLAAMLPAPYQNLVRYHGVFANRSRFRPRLPLPPEVTAGRAPPNDADADADADASPSAHRCAHRCAASMLDETPTGPPLQLQLPLGQHGAHAPLTTAPTDVPAGPSPTATEEPDTALDLDAGGLADIPVVRPRRLPWASLLMRSLGVDGLQCPSCGAQMVLLALITAPATVTKILDHLHIPSTPPPLAPPRQTAEPLLFDDELEQTDPSDDVQPASATSKLTHGAAAPRAPP